MQGLSLGVEGSGLVQGRRLRIISGQVETGAVGASSREGAPLWGSGGMPPQKMFGIWML